MAMVSSAAGVVVYAMFVWEAEPGCMLRFVWDEGTGRWQVQRVNGEGGRRGPVKSGWSVVVWEGNQAGFRRDFGAGLGVLMESRLDEIRKAVN